MAKKLVLSLGSNQGDRDFHLREAQRLLSKAFGLPILKSEIIETEPEGVPDHPPYLNQVLVYDCNCTLRQAFTICQDTEKILGRTDKGKLRPRTIDIDVCSFGDEIVSEPDLVVPHPSLAFRRFVLEPLVSIWPGWVHPVLGNPATELLENCLRSSETKEN